MTAPFAKIAIIGLGLQGGSIGLAVQQFLPDAITTGFDLDPATRARAAQRGLVHLVCETAFEAVDGCDLVIFCVPPGAMGAAAAAVAQGLPATAVVSDVGSCKVAIAKALTEALPGHIIIPAHPVAGTENSGPDAGFASLFKGRWCIITPLRDPTIVDKFDLEKETRLATFWEALGAKVEFMDPAREVFGEPRFEALLRERRGEPLDEFCAAIRTRLAEHARGAEAIDDVSILALEYQGAR